ncbi:MAG: hypothetical protein QOI48_2876 [Solirubrobacteraceae bacterium]|jgi:hypothetical protein|nr:hypothetical protein [Solirubrobacteraceae bacterium]
MRTFRRCVVASSRWLALAVVVLAAGTAAPAAMSGTSKAPTPLLDRLDAMWSKGDVAAFGSVYGRGAVVSYYVSGVRFVGRSQIVQEMQSAHACNYTIKRIAPVAVHGQFAATFKTVKGTGACAGPVTFLAVYQIQHGKVVRDWHLLPGTTPPFDQVAPE